MIPEHRVPDNIGLFIQNSSSEGVDIDWRMSFCDSLLPEALQVFRIEVEDFIRSQANNLVPHLNNTTREEIRCPLVDVEVTKVECAAITSVGDIESILLYCPP